LQRNHEDGDDVLSRATATLIRGKEVLGGTVDVESRCPGASRPTLASAREAAATEVAMTGNSGLRLEIRRVLRTPRAVVFHALSDPDELAKYWGPEGFTIPSVESELHAGGHYRIAMQPPEGERFYLEGEFLEVDPPRVLSYTFRWEPPDDDDRETVVRLSLHDLSGASTELLFTQGDFATERRRKVHEDGWTQTLDKLESLVSPQGRRSPN
jgi:uncharacterized protein YndB with AHSA1/START domain